ncbi:hypothetical protein AB4Z09_02455 [Rhodococcus sp. TAF43]|uniref:hypothetical protein n=1 Tax=Rhodococcus sp. TAF43 TaxID=3237483 RepID=UPI003F983627
MKFGWESQMYPPHGATAAEGIRNQLGRPALNYLTVLVREAAQNSWDARSDTRPVDFRIELNDLGAGMAPVWRRLLEPTAPTVSQLPLRQSLAKPIRVLSVSDRGTKGLGGPTRADNAVTTDNNFVSFVRNIGEPRNRDFGGGTYGFGKGIFYLLSRTGTVLIHTRCRVEGGFETRLIGCSLWKSYSVGDGMEGKRFTGRHWWGDTSGEVIEPFVGAAAERLAHQLGFEQFGEKETGTTIIVVDPDLDDREPDEAARAIADAIAWNLWPKMIDKPDGSPSDIRFSVLCNGNAVPIPDPLETSPLRLFVQAYRKLDEPESNELWVKSPKIYLGKLGLHKTMMKPFEPSSVAEECGFKDTSHHVCLMRTPELVVKYLKGPATGARFTSYAGVFRADATVDEAFARSEPPTHDDWRHEPLEGTDRKVVRVTYQRIKESLSSLVELGSEVVSATVNAPLGAASRQFSSLVAGSFGFGGMTAAISPKNDHPACPVQDQDLAQTPKGGGRQGDGRESSRQGAGHDRSRDLAQFGGGYGGGASSRAARSGLGRHRAGARPRIVYVGEPGIEIRGGDAVVVQRFRITEPGSYSVRADVGVAIPSNKGKETDPPVNATQPVVLGWDTDDHDAFVKAASLDIAGGDTIWKVIVRPAPDTVTSIDLVAERKAVEV